LLQVPRRGAKKKLVDSVVETAARSLEMEQARRLTPEAIDAGLKELKERLGLPAVPSRIECYDMSNLRGSTAVGSMVVLEKGRPTPAQYRRFRIRTGASADDCAMIQETLMRRFKKGAASEGAWAHTPDLVLVDGGKGQLNAALQVRRLLGLAHIPMAGLAKENEDVFVPGRPSPVDLPKDSIALQILQRARDEAHRVAIGYHRRLRRRGTVASELDAVPGIGPKRKRALLRRFGSVRAVREAPIEELRATEGITAALADRIKQHL